MNSLRFLLVHRSPRQSEEIAALLTRANHSVLPTIGLAEAADALTVERFDAVLLESDFQTSALKEFSAGLRRMEQAQHNATRVPVIGLDHNHNGNALHAEPIPDGANGISENGLDAVIPEPIDPDAIVATILKLSQAVSHSGQDGAADYSAMVIIDPEKFSEQVGYDNELLVEIIDLFLVERARQEVEMHEALMKGDFELLSRLAHTIKGSLASIHAMRARAHAQELETQSKTANEDICWELLAALEADLVELEPELQRLRQP